MLAPSVAASVAAMSEASNSDRSAGMADMYRIRLHGHLDHDWSAWMGDVRVTHHPDATTELVGVVADQAALHGLLKKVRDLGVPLLWIGRIAIEHPPTAGNAPGEPAA
jgi:hypothetical protein